MSTDAQPPSFGESIPTLYDDTHRGKWAHDIEIATMGNRANLIGHLEHHSNDTDGSFGICVAGGKGVVISKSLLESIPSEHRPPLNDKDRCTVEFSLIESKSEAIGSTYIPFLLTNKQTGKRFRIKLYAVVVPNLLIPMFIGRAQHHGGPFLSEERWGGRDGPEFTFEFGGVEVEVQGV